MLKAKQMARIQISGSKNVLGSTISVLHGERVMHIMDYNNQADAFEIGQPSSESPAISREIVDVRAMMSYLKAPTGKHEGVASPGKAGQRFRKIAGQFNSLVQEKDALEARLKGIAGLKDEFGPLTALGIPASAYRGYESIHVFRGFIRGEFEQELKKATRQYELHTGVYNNRAVFALFVPKKHQQAVAALLERNGYAELPLPRAEIDVPALAQEERGAMLRLSEIKSRFEDMRKGEAAFLAGYERYLARESEKAEAPLRFATSGHAFVIDGWVPAARLPRVISELRGATGGKISIETLKDADDAPVALDNPQTIQPFEFFLDLYSLPRYLEIDPTAVMFLTFPLFFGFMLGDIGYGMVTLALFFALSLKVKGEAKALLNALVVASIATIVFGVVFGEFFGAQVIEHPLLHRAHDMETMMMVSIAVGFVHVNLGYILGFFNVLKQHGFPAALLEKGSWMVIELGVILFGAQHLGYLPAEAAYAGGAAALLGLGMLIKGEGATGLIELPALASNILSYARLFAVGLASVSLALVVNKFATNLVQQGGWYIPIAILVLVVGHALNIVLGILGPFLHSLRLHYVEFFTKFYKGGGARFIPFGKQMGAWEMADAGRARTR